ncbi:MAG: ABC transporter ATP-binding protein [Chloroflexota bacterium]
MQVLETHDLAVGYDMPRKPRVTVADNLNLALQAGELVCLLGPNGAGKSTLMRTIAGMQKALAGDVVLAGQSLANIQPRQLAKMLSVVLTDRPNVGLLNGYALVALGRHPYTDWTGRLSRYDEAVVRWAVDAVNARDLAERPILELSDGQRQKLMIARALAQESELIILDEPTAFLDLPRRAEIMQLLRHLAAETGRAILLSTHDLDLALRSADTLWLMAHGKIYVGAPEDLVLDGTFEAAFRGEGVHFDRTTGSFEVNRQRAGMVCVRGHGIPHTWTRRALQRAGYTLDDNAPIEVIVTGEQNPTWQIIYGSKHNYYDSIRDLLDGIRDLLDGIRDIEQANDTITKEYA